MIGGEGVEDQAAADAPRRLALDPQDPRLPEVDRQVIRMSLPEWDQDSKASAHQSGQNGRLSLVPASPPRHGTM